MKKQESIGGYFELEINDLGSLYHDKAIALNTGRNALEHILNCKKYTHIYVPYYTCDVILEPIKKTGHLYSFYHIDKNFLPEISELNSNEALLYTNYFGLMGKNIQYLKDTFKNLIIDNSQAFYDMPNPNTPTFYSPRKFFGLPDGGFVYHANEISFNDYSIDSSYKRFEHLLKSIDLGKELSYQAFKSNDASLVNQPIKQMSLLTKKLLKGIDFEKIKECRKSNFKYLHDHLKETNLLTSVIKDVDFICPMVYPYLANNNKKLRKQLIINKIFTPIYWDNVLQWVDENTFEFELTNNVIHLPVDQRYNKDDMLYNIKTVKDFINE